MSRSTLHCLCGKRFLSRRSISPMSPIRRVSVNGTDVRVLVTNPAHAGQRVHTLSARGIATGDIASIGPLHERAPVHRFARGHRGYRGRYREDEQETCRQADKLEWAGVQFRLQGSPHVFTVACPRPGRVLRTRLESYEAQRHRLAENSAAHCRLRLRDPARLSGGISIGL